MNARANISTKISHIEMSVEEWAKIKDCPTQRDTLKHLHVSSAAGRHLATPHPTHAMVSMAQTPKGQRWKLDGHTRSLAWVSGQLAPAPEVLQVTVYEVKNRAECIDYYNCFDNSGATENRRDKLAGALKFHSCEPNHGFLFSNTGVISAIEYTIFPNKWADLREISFLEMLAPWVEAIKWMDAGDFPNHSLFRSPVMLAALMSFRRDQNVALSFWQGFHDDIGTKGSKDASGIFLARDCLTIMKHEQENRYGRRMFNTYTPYFLWCYDKWFSDTKAKRFPSIEGKKPPKDMLTVRQWWEEYLGELDHPHIRPKKESDEDQLELI